jgi:hypothetical protein
VNGPIAAIELEDGPHRRAHLLALRIVLCSGARPILSPAGFVSIVAVVKIRGPDSKRF